MPLEPERYEVKPPAGSTGASRFYLIEPQISETGYGVLIRREQDNEVIWRCDITFEISADMQAPYSHGNVDQAREARARPRSHQMTTGDMTPGAIAVRRSAGGGLIVPPLIAAAGKRASRRFVEFFTANIRNRNTREAYSRAINAFLAWCDAEAGTALEMIEPVVIAAYVEKLLKDGLSKPTVKQHLAAIRMLFDRMVTGGVLAVNPASAVRGPKYVIKKGKTPVLTPEEARLPCPITMR